MPNEPTVQVTLDRPRFIRWTPRADARLSSFGANVDDTILSMKDRHKILYALCLLLWCACTDREEFPYKEPVDVADNLATVKAQHDAMTAVRAMLQEAGVLKESKKKSSPAEKPSDSGRSAS